MALLDYARNFSLSDLEKVKDSIVIALKENPERPDAQAALDEVNQLIKTKTPIMKFYHLVNANRTIHLAGPDKQTLSFNFHPYEMTGTHLGVYATEKPAEIAALDEAVKNPKSGITSITKEQYDTSIKKKGAAQNSYQPSLAASTPTPGVQAAPSAVGAPIETSPSQPEPPAAPLNNVEAATEVVPVQLKAQ